MPLILGTNSIKDTGYDVANSLRFETNTYLQFDISSNGNARTWTYSFWIKRTKLGSWMNTHNFGGTGNRDYGAFDSSDRLELAHSNSGYQYRFLTNRVFRDIFSWSHIVIAMDTTQNIESNRTKIYINGVQETSFNTASYPSQNHDTRGSQNRHMIGSDFDPSNYYSGYQAENVFINGLQLGADSFGEFDEDSGIWKPKNVSGLTFGTNGFYLEYKESGTSQNSSGMGADTSGNNNHFAVNNLTAIDQSTDTCTNNFATLNPLVPYSSATFSEGNLKIVSQTYASIVSTIAVSQGKWYAEMRSTDISAGTGFMGITSNLPTASNYEAYNQSGSIVGYGVTGNGSAYGNGGGFGSWGGWSNNAIIMMAVDLDNNKLYWGVDGTWGSSSNPSTNTNGGSITSASSTTQGVYWFFCNSQTNDNATLEYNFGSPPYAISSGNADGNGYGNFEYAVPSGYFSLCTKNLAEYG